MASAGTGANADADAGAAQLSDSNLFSEVNQTEIEAGVYVDVCTPGGSFVGMVRTCDDGMYVMICGVWQFTIYVGDGGLLEACGVRTGPDGPVETVHDCVVIVTGEKANADVIAATNAASASVALARPGDECGALRSTADDDDDDAGGGSGGAAAAAASSACSIACDESVATHARVRAMADKYSRPGADDCSRTRMCSHDRSAWNQAVRSAAAVEAAKLAAANAKVAHQIRPRPYGSAPASRSAYFAFTHAAAALAYRIVFAKLTAPSAEKSENVGYVGCATRTYANLARKCASESSAAHTAANSRTIEASRIAAMKISELSGTLVDAACMRLGPFEHLL